MSDKNKLTSLNVFLLLFLTIVLIFAIYVGILLFTRPPIFNIFGEKGEFFPTSIWVTIAASMIVAIFLSFILLIPNIPIKKKKETKSKPTVAIVAAQGPQVAAAVSPITSIPSITPTPQSINIPVATTSTPTQTNIQQAPVQATTPITGIGSETLYVKSPSPVPSSATTPVISIT